VDNFCLFVFKKYLSIWLRWVWIAAREIFHCSDLVALAYLLWACGILVPWLGINQTYVPCIARQILNHWTTREVLDFVTQGKEYFPGYLRINSFLSPRSELLILMEKRWGQGVTEPGGNLTSKRTSVVDSYLPNSEKQGCPAAAWGSGQWELQGWKGHSMKGWLHTGENESVSHSVVSDSLWPHELQPSRLLCPWDYPGKNTGVGCHFLLPGIFPTQGLNPCLLHRRQILYHFELPKWMKTPCYRTGLRPSSKCFTCIHSLTPPTTRQCRHYYYPHFTDEETEAQRGQLMRPSSHSQVAGLQFEV